MVSPVKTLAKQFVDQSPATLLAFGILVALVELIAFYIAAVRDGVLRIDQGIGLLNHYGLFSTIFGNAISWYAAKKYYDGVCSIRCSEAVVEKAVVEEPLKDLKKMVGLHGKHQFVMYFFVLIGTYFWASNFAIQVFGDSMAKWGHVFDSVGHPWSFLVGRLHLIYSWIIVMPFVVHVVIWSSFQLRKTMTVASDEGVLTYDLLNPDQRGGFGFIDNSLLAFNIFVALVYSEIMLHNVTFDRLNFEHIIDYIILTSLLIGINKMFFASLYAKVRTLRLEALKKVKDKVFKNDELSFEILKYCYERKIRTTSIANFVIQACAIAIPGIVKFWPLIVKTMTRV